VLKVLEKSKRKKERYTYRVYTQIERQVYRKIDQNIQCVPGVKVTISGFNSRADSESKTSYALGSNSQRFWSYEFLNYGYTWPQVLWSHE
jgi:hypothetical protein